VIFLVLKHTLRERQKICGDRRILNAQQQHSPITFASKPSRILKRRVRMRGKISGKKDVAEWKH
jgi:hypothetical protein